MKKEYIVYACLIAIILILILFTPIRQIIPRGSSGISILASNPVEGTWLWTNPLGNIEVHINSGGTGTWTLPDGRLEWTSTSQGFEGKVYFDQNGKTVWAPVTGTLSSDGKQLLVYGFGTWGFSRDESITFTRF